MDWLHSGATHQAFWASDGHINRKRVGKNHDDRPREGRLASQPRRSRPQDRSRNCRGRVDICSDARPMAGSTPSFREECRTGRAADTSPDLPEVTCGCLFGSPPDAIQSALWEKHKSKLGLSSRISARSRRSPLAANRPWSVCRTDLTARADRRRPWLLDQPRGRSRGRKPGRVLAASITGARKRGRCVVIASEFTVFAKSGGPLTKRISLVADGSLKSDGSACIMTRGVGIAASGYPISAILPMRSVVLNRRPSALRAVCGPICQPKSKIVTKAMLNGSTRPDPIARTGKISATAGAGQDWCCSTTTPRACRSRVADPHETPPPWPAFPKRHCSRCCPSLPALLA